MAVSPNLPDLDRTECRRNDRPPQGECQRERRTIHRLFPASYARALSTLECGRAILPSNCGHQLVQRQGEPNRIGMKHDGQHHDIRRPCTDAPGLPSFHLRRFEGIPYLVVMPFGDVCKQPRATSSGRCGAVRKALRDPSEPFDSSTTRWRLSKSNSHPLLLSLFQSPVHWCPKLSKFSPHPRRRCRSVCDGRTPK